jgi:hypothetical protein
VSYVANDAQNVKDDSPDAGQQVTTDVVRSHIERSIGVTGHPVVAQVNDGDLPDRAQSQYKGHGQLIAVIGYDNTNHTYTSVETCVDQVGGTIQTDGPDTDGTGTHTIPQDQLYQAMRDDPGEGALIW